jgi:hypothetical protein
VRGIIIFELEKYFSTTKKQSELRSRQQRTSRSPQPMLSLGDRTTILRTPHKKWQKFVNVNSSIQRWLTASKIVGTDRDYSPKLPHGKLHQHLQVSPKSHLCAIISFELNPSCTQ